MLSYVIPTQESTSDSNTKNTQNSVSQRNLSLNLNALYEGHNVSSQQSSEVHNSHKGSVNSQLCDSMLANIPNVTMAPSDSCDEQTRLLIGNTPPRPRRQVSNNNHCSTNNNNIGGNGDTVAGGDAYIDSGGSFCIISDEGTQFKEVNSTSTKDAVATNKEPRQPSKKPVKLNKIGSKTVGLKRVSFGSSKGSMVETLVFETPTPLSEHVEPSFTFDSDPCSRAISNSNTNYAQINMDDSGIEVQDDPERSIVRVSIYQSSQPQQICPPEYLPKFEDNLYNSFSNYNYSLEDIMTAASPIPGYDRQQSTDSGWDNPFRPGGDLSREADEIVSMIRGGKPITPTEDHSLINAQHEANSRMTENVTKTNITQTQSAQNGTNSHKIQSSTIAATVSKSPEKNGVTTSLAHVSKQVVPGPTSASHVVIDEKKNKKKGCCVIQ